MPIVASNDTPPDVRPGALQKAQEMRDILDLDMEEAEIAKRVKAFYVEDMELEIQAWGLLKWKEQEAWRIYRGMRISQD